MNFAKLRTLVALLVALMVLSVESQSAPVFYVVPGGAGALWNGICYNYPVTGPSQLPCRKNNPCAIPDTSTPLTITGGNSDCVIEIVQTLPERRYRVAFNAMSVPVQHSLYINIAGPVANFTSFEVRNAAPAFIRKSPTATSSEVIFSSVALYSRFATASTVSTGNNPIYASLTFENLTIINTCTDAALQDSAKRWQNKIEKIDAKHGETKSSEIGPENTKNSGNYGETNENYGNSGIEKIGSKIRETSLYGEIDPTRSSPSSSEKREAHIETQATEEVHAKYWIHLKQCKFQWNSTGSMTGIFVMSGSRPASSMEVALVLTSVEFDVQRHIFITLLESILGVTSGSAQTITKVRFERCLGVWNTTSIGGGSILRHMEGVNRSAVVEFVDDTRMHVNVKTLWTSSNGISAPFSLLVHSSTLELHGDIGFNDYYRLIWHFEAVNASVSGYPLKNVDLLLASSNISTPYYGMDPIPLLTPNFTIIEVVSSSSLTVGSATFNKTNFWISSGAHLSLLSDSSITIPPSTPYYTDPIWIQDAPFAFKHADSEIFHSDAPLASQDSAQCSISFDDVISFEGIIKLRTQCNIELKGTLLEQTATTENFISPSIVAMDVLVATGDPSSYVYVPSLHTPKISVHVDAETNYSASIDFSKFVSLSMTLPSSELDPLYLESSESQLFNLTSVLHQSAVELSHTETISDTISYPYLVPLIPGRHFGAPESRHVNINWSLASTLGVYGEKGLNVLNFLAYFSLASPPNSQVTGKETFVSTDSKYIIRYGALYETPQAQDAVQMTFGLSPNTCKSPRPSNQFTCIDGVWVATGNVVVPTITITTTNVRVLGNLTVTGSVIFTPDGSSISIQGGCFFIGPGQGVTIDLSETDPKKLPKSLTLITQSSECSNSLSLIPVSLKQPKNNCAKVKSKLDSKSSKSSLTVLFVVDRSACNTKWIILGSILGVVAILAVVAIIATVTIIKSNKKKSEAKRVAGAS